MKRISRKPSNLSESLHRQLNMYALAASAAGVSLLALTQPAEARIVYTHVHRRLPINRISPLDLNHDGQRDFTFNDTHGRTSGGGWGVLTVSV
jgi:hypothetical protein